MLRFLTLWLDPRPRHHEGQEWGVLDNDGPIRDILSSLVRNTNLKELSIIADDYLLETDCLDSSKLLCDVSSFESISNSNHTLERISLARVWSTNRHQTLPTLAEQCLVLNENENKTKVIHNKILQFYFVGEFDISALVNMSVSVLPTIMSQIQGNGKHSATYRLLQCIPELCNVSGRASSYEPANNKWRRMSLVHNSPQCYKHVF
jgi:hypothetical protein